MQPWDQAKVINAKSKHAGRAGVVQATRKDGEDQRSTVMLDATPTADAVAVEFADTDLQRLG